MHWKPNPTNPSTNPTPPPTIPTSEKWLKVNVPLLDVAVSFSNANIKTYLQVVSVMKTCIGRYLPKTCGVEVVTSKWRTSLFWRIQVSEYERNHTPNTFGFFGSCKRWLKEPPKKILGHRAHKNAQKKVHLLRVELIGWSMQSWLAVVKRATPKENLHLNMLKQGQTLKEFHTPSNHVWFAIRAGGCFLGTLFTNDKLFPG